MRCTGDPITVVNLALCIIILALGYLGHAKNKNKLALSIGIAFGLFAVSHLIAFFGLTATLAGLLMIVRVLAYLVIIFALYWAAIK